MAAVELSQAKAQSIQDQAVANGTWIMWFISSTHPAFPGSVVAWAVTVDLACGTRTIGHLVSDTLEQLRELLPSGLIRRDRASAMSGQVIETWD